MQLTLKQLGVAVTECVSLKDVFTSNVVSSVLGSLVQAEPLPLLLMRTILKSWEVHSDMRRCAFLLADVQAPAASTKGYPLCLPMSADPRCCRAFAVPAAPTTCRCRRWLYGPETLLLWREARQRGDPCTCTWPVASRGPPPPPPPAQGGRRGQ